MAAVERRGIWWPNPPEDAAVDTEGVAWAKALVGREQRTWRTSPTGERPRIPTIAQSVWIDSPSRRQNEVLGSSTRWRATSLREDATDAKTRDRESANRRPATPIPAAARWDPSKAPIQEAVGGVDRSSPRSRAIWAWGLSIRLSIFSGIRDGQEATAQNRQVI
jgi:hypothetical protein